MTHAEYDRLEKRLIAIVTDCYYAGRAFGVDRATMQKLLVEEVEWKLCRVGEPDPDPPAPIQIKEPYPWE